MPLDAVYALVYNTSFKHLDDTTSVHARALVGRFAMSCDVEASSGVNYGSSPTPTPSRCLEPRGQRNYF